MPPSKKSRRKAAPAEASKNVRPRAPRPSKKPTLTPESSAAIFHSAVANDVLSFGSGDMSQLGLGDDEAMRERKKPTLLKSLAGVSVDYLAAGSLHNAVITADGTVMTWGCNDDHALGHNDDEWLPSLVEGPLGKGHPSQQHKQKQSKDDSTIEQPPAKRRRGRSSTAAVVVEPVKVSDVAESEPLRVIQICCGASHTIALTNSGAVYSWGTYRDGNGVMGFSATVEVAEKPELLTLATKYGEEAVMIACGENHDLALSANGDVYQWGNVNYGARFTERHRKSSKLTPTAVLMKRTTFHRAPIHISKVFAGGSSSFAVTIEGRVFSWGPNNYGQTGHASPINIHSPTFIKDLPPIKMIAAANHHAVFLTTDGKVYTVGKNDDGRLGLGHRKDVSTPTLVANLPTISYVAVGEAHTLLVTESGELLTCGYGDLLQLGNGVEEDVDTPTRVVSQLLEKECRIVLQAGGGSQHSLILARKRDGSSSSSSAASSSSSVTRGSD